MNIKETLDRIKIYRTSPEWNVLSKLIYNSTIIKYNEYIEIYYNEDFSSYYNEIVRIEHKKKRIYFNVQLNYVIKKFRQNDDWYKYNSDSIINFLHIYFTKYKDYDIYGKILN